jgi:putative two-component system response regulator
MTMLMNPPLRPPVPYPNPASTLIPAEKPRDTVLVIDDSPEILGIINALLKDDYRLKAANGGEKGLRLAVSEPKPDIILLDIMMPDLSGHEVCRRLKADRLTRDIPVIFLTAMNNEADEETGFELGAVDYIAKPISGPILRARVKTQLGVKLAADFIKDKNVFLVGEVSKQAKELEFIQDVTILALASLAETRDNETGNHLRRTQHYVRALAVHLQRQPHFSHLLTRTNIELIFKSAPLHDIGKVGVPDSILLKPGRLTAEEFEVMKLHPALGKEAIEHAEQQMGRSAPFLHFAKEIAGSHQEKWDGSGYPEGLAGESIPISARLMAVADVYDALVSRRVYKPGMSHEAASEIIHAGRGTHFDPEIVDAFVDIQAQFREIAARFSDDAEAKTNPDTNEDFGKGVARGCA